MNKTDQEMLSEAYTQVQEGIFSRVGARGAGMLGAAKDAVQRGKGQVQKAAGRLASAAGAATAGAEIQAAGQAEIELGQGSGLAKKQESIKNSIIKGAINDIEKLGIEGTDELSNEVQKQLSKIFDEYFKINKNPENYDAQGNELA
jgi:hypothetical protein